jgi:hypothetical protein
MRFLIILLTILLFSSTPIVALEEGFYSTISFGVNSIGKEGLEYDESEVVGADSYEAIHSKSIVYLANNEYRRRLYHYEDIALPPYSKIDVGYFWINNMPHEVDAETIRIPLSRELEENGDVSTLLYDIGFEKGETCTSQMCKEGKYLDVEGVGLLSSDMYKDPKNGVVIETLTVKPSVEITKYEIEYISEYVSRIKLYVKNSTDMDLVDVKINYKNSVDRVIDIAADEEVVTEVYKQCSLEVDKINCGSVKIIDNSRQRECIIYGSSYDNFDNPESITVFSKINGEWYSGSQIQPTIERFCIERLPYTYTTQDMVVDILPEEAEKTDEQYWQELLNIDILPITSYRLTNYERYITLLKPLIVDNL